MNEHIIYGILITHLFDHLEEIGRLVEALSFLLHLILEVLPFVVEFTQLVLDVPLALGIGNKKLLARGLRKLLDPLLEQLFCVWVRDK